MRHHNQSSLFQLNLYNNKTPKGFNSNDIFLVDVSDLIKPRRTIRYLVNSLIYIGAISAVGLMVAKYSAHIIKRNIVNIQTDNDRC